MLWLYIALAAVVLLVWFIADHRARRQTAAHWARKLEESKSDTALARAQWEGLEIALADEQRRHQSRIETITGILNEKEVWRKKNWEEAIAHGNAQVLMMEHIERLEHRLRAAGIKPPEISALNQVQEEFREKFVKPALQESGNSEVNKRELGTTTVPNVTGQMQQVYPK